MIKNDGQSGIVRGRVERLERLQDELLERLKKESDNRKRLELELRTVRAETRRMREELEGYEALKAGRADIGAADQSKTYRDC